MSHTVEAAPTRPWSPAQGRISHGSGFWVIAAAFTVALAFSTLPTPLYGLYQQRDGFPTFVITIVFAAYAVGVVTSLYLAGHVSDWLGRRHVFAAALVVEALSALIFVAWPAVPGLIIARLVNGVAIGALTATATAHLSELRLVTRPQDDPARSGLISSVVNMGGLAMGPLVSAVLSQYVSSPLTTPFLIFLGLLLISALAVTLVPETVVRREVRPAYRPQRISLPRAAKPIFFGAATGGFAAFAITGLFMALAPTLLAQTLHETSKLLGGFASFSMLATAALAQVVFARLATQDQLRFGFILMAIGLVAIPTAVFTTSLWLFLIAGVVAGAGVGLGFRAAVATVARLADPSLRGEVLAAFFLATYAGLVGPVLLIGVALIWLPSPAAVLLFTALELGLLGWAARRTSFRPAGSFGQQVRPRRFGCSRPP
ncbi:MAG: MFS transporter [Kibdelosporangium sp.]